MYAYGCLEREEEPMTKEDYNKMLEVEIEGEFVGDMKSILDKLDLLDDEIYIRIENSLDDAQSYYWREKWKN